MGLTARPAQKGDAVTPTVRWWLGVDWGSAAHVLTLVDARGAVAATRTVAHRADAMQDALQWVRSQTGCAPAEIAVAIETPRGPVVESFLEHGFPVFAVNPKQLDRFRDRFTVAGAKDDARDAHVLADGLRTDPRAFHRVQPEDPRIIRLRALRRLREDLVEQQGRLTNRLREQLYRVDAPWLVFSPAADDPWLWAMLALAPDPTAWPTLSRRRIAAVLYDQRIRRFTPDDVRAALQGPRLGVAPGVSEAVMTQIETLVAQLQLTHGQLGTVERRMDHLLEDLAAAAAADGEPVEHRDVEILRSLPGVGRMVTATMLTEAGQAIATRDYSMLRAHAGAAPVTNRSGKRAVFVHMRYACKRCLRDALYHWAKTSVVHDAAARDYYRQLRARGHSYARALRSVADRWLRILVAMLKTRTLYDASRFVLNTAAGV
jgi:transposase